MEPQKQMNKKAEETLNDREQTGQEGRSRGETGEGN